MNIARLSRLLVTSLVALGLLAPTALAADRTAPAAQMSVAPAPERADAPSVGPTAAKKTRRKARKAKRRGSKRARVSKQDRASQAIARQLNAGADRRAIDSAFDAGALTWSEAKALYAEQSLVRLSFIAHRGASDGNLARVRFMRDTARTSLLRLRHNLAQRIYVDQPADGASPPRELAGSP